MVYGVENGAGRMGEGSGKSKKTRMKLYFERKFHKRTYKTAESSLQGNKVPIIPESIAKNEESGYNFHKTKNE